jgi:hypothetical protein
VGDLALDHVRAHDGVRMSWSASGRRRAVADDARAREVEPHHNSDEASEQSGVISAAELVERRVGAEENAETMQLAPGAVLGKTRVVWSVYGAPQVNAVMLRGGNRMRESR